MSWISPLACCRLLYEFIYPIIGFSFFWSPGVTEPNDDQDTTAHGSAEPSPVAEYHRQRAAELMQRFRRKTAWIYSAVGAVILIFNRTALVTSPFESGELILLLIILVGFPVSWWIGVVRFRGRLERDF